ncbi:MAG TPA: hypothetical protein VLJ42_05250 [Solirubrobacteraceae bacterium]|nr:hypothetical protein [Solirubrobacteraceae bacterium]
MVMMDQSKRLAQPLAWTRAGKLAVAATCACFLLAAVGMGLFALLSDDPGTRQGCIKVSGASYVGSATIQACGHDAAVICGAGSASVGAAATADMRQACRQAGLTYGSPRTATPES